MIDNDDNDLHETIQFQIFKDLFCYMDTKYIKRESSLFQQRTISVTILMMLAYIWLYKMIY